MTAPGPSCSSPWPRNAAGAHLLAGGGLQGDLEGLHGHGSAAGARLREGRVGLVRMRRDYWRSRRSSAGIGPSGGVPDHPARDQPRWWRTWGRALAKVAAGRPTRAPHTMVACILPECCV